MTEAIAPQPIHRLEYQRPTFTIERVDLRFELHESHTDVHSRMQIQRTSESNLKTPLRSDVSVPSRRLSAAIARGRRSSRSTRYR